MPGDKVRIERDTCSHGIDIGTIVEVTMRCDEESFRHNLGATYIYDREVSIVGIRIVEGNSEKTMTLKEKFNLAFKNEPEKSLQQSGLTGSDDSLTSEGKDIFLSWLLKKNAADFKTEVADAIIAEDAKESK